MARSTAVRSSRSGSGGGTRITASRDADSSIFNFRLSMSRPSMSASSSLLSLPMSHRRAVRAGSGSSSPLCGGRGSHSFSTQSGSALFQIGAPADLHVRRLERRLAVQEDGYLLVGLGIMAGLHESRDMPGSKERSRRLVELVCRDRRVRDELGDLLGSEVELYLLGSLVQPIPCRKRCLAVNRTARLRVAPLLLGRAGRRR